MKNGNNTTPSATCGTSGGGGSTPTPTPTTSTPPPSSSCSAGYVGLTFDDGPNTGTTNQLVSTLRNAGATATVFPTGSNASSNPSLMQAYKNAGLQIGNHSWDHPHLVNMSQSDIQSQLSRTQTAIQQTAGVTPTLFRPPYGETNQTLKNVESSLGLREIIWDVDSNDWNNASADAIRQAAARLTNGQIILMHDWPAATLQALPNILQRPQVAQPLHGAHLQQHRPGGRTVHLRRRRVDDTAALERLVHRHRDPGRRLVRPVQRELHGQRCQQLDGHARPQREPERPEQLERERQRPDGHLDRLRTRSASPS